VAGVLFYITDWLRYHDIGSELIVFVCSPYVWWQCHAHTSI